MLDAIPSRTRSWRSAGVWMSVLIAAMMVLNTVRAASDPVAFASYFGFAGAADASPAFVLVYASRALFLAVITAILIAKYQGRALMWFALAAIVMPVSDALQVALAQGPSAIVARHIAIAVYLGITAFLLHRLVVKTEA